MLGIFGLCLCYRVLESIGCIKYRIKREGRLGYKTSKGERDMWYINQAKSRDINLGRQDRLEHVIWT